MVVRQDVVQIGFDVDMAAIDKLTSELNELKRSVNSDLNKGLGETAKQTDKLKRSSQNLGKGIQDTTQQTDKLHRSVEGLGNTSAFTKLKSGFSKVSTAAKNLGSQIDSAANAITSKLFNVKSLIAGLIGGTVVKTAVDVVVDRQNITSQFEVLLGSADKAKKRIEDLTEFASTTPFTRDEIFAASKQLQVFTGDALSTGDSLRVIGDVAAGTGQGFEEVALWTGRLYDAMKSGNKVGEMTSRLQEMGAISGEDRAKIEALAEAGGDIETRWAQVEKIFGRFNGTMDKLSKNLGNMLTSLKSFATNSFFLPIGEGIADGLQPAIEKFREFRKTNKDDVDAMSAVLKKFTENICIPLFSKIESGAEVLIKMIGSLKDGVQGLEKFKGKSVFLDNIIRAIQYVIEHKDGIISTLKQIALVCASIVVVSKIKQLISALMFFTTPLGMISLLLVGLFKLLESKGVTLSDVLQKLGSAFKWVGDNIKWLLPLAGGLFGAFMLFKGVRAVMPLFNRGGGGDSPLGQKGGLFSSIAKIKTTDILKAMANITLIVGGITLLASVLIPIYAELAKITDMKSILKVTAVIAVLGTVGTGLAWLAGKVGNIPVSKVSRGLANIAVILTGMSALYLLVGSVSLVSFDLKQMLAVVKMIGIVGLVGSALAAFAGLVGLIPIPIVLKGFANIALALTGMSALYLLVGALSLIRFDTNQMIQVLKMIGIIGLVGSALSVLAGLIGLIPIPVILTGLANIALVIGGLTAIIAAYGALAKIPGFNDFISSGGDALANVFKQIGKVGGALVGGFGEGLSDSLPTIGKNIASFVQTLAPAFASLKGIDMTSVGAFFNQLANFLLKLTVNDLLSTLTGGTNLETLGTQLSLFAENSAGFFTAVAQLPKAGIENTRLLFNALAGINSLPKDGGIKQWFTGTVNFENLANGLGQLSSEQVIGFFNAIANIPSNAFEQTKALFNALSGVNGLPKEGGIQQWFTGTINYDNLANGLGKLSSEPVMGFFRAVQQIPQIAFENTKTLFETLASVKGLPNSGGIFQYFTGDTLKTLESLTEKLPPFGKAVATFYQSISQITDYSKINQLFEALGSLNDNVDKKGGLIQWATSVVAGDKETGLEKLGSGLKKFGENTKEFFQSVNALNVDNLNALWDSLKRPADITDNVSKVVSENIADMVKKITNLPVQMGEGILSTGDSLKDSLVTIWVEAAKAIASPVNKIIEGANWILKQFDSDKVIASWTPYAKGTDGHKGGNALVNDGRGAELVQMPNGQSFIPRGRNVFIPNAPKGMKVFPAEQTARMMGKNKPTFHYAKGTGNDIDIFEYIDNASGLVDQIEKTYVSYDGMSGFPLDAGKALVSTVKPAMAKWADKQFEEFGALSLEGYEPSKGLEQWKMTVIRALKMEGLYSPANVALTLFQMDTESRGNPRAINLTDQNAKNGTPSKGLMQVIDPTFRAYARPGFNQNVYDPLSNILASIRYAVSTYGSLAKAFRGTGYANGGLVTKPGFIGEEEKEMVIPLAANKRKRGISLWEQTGQMLGVSLPSYTPDNSAVSVGSNGDVSETNTYSPVFNLTINGSTDTRSQARQVKQWIQEAMDEMFDSMNRKVSIREV